LHVRGPDGGVPVAAENPACGRALARAPTIGLETEAQGVQPGPWRTSARRRMTGLGYSHHFTNVASTSAFPPKADIQGERSRATISSGWPGSPTRRMMGTWPPPGAAIVGNRWSAAGRGRWMML